MNTAAMTTLPEAERLLTDAERATGLNDWGGETLFEPTFRHLFTALRVSVVDDAQLTPEGLAGAEMRLRLMAETRLRFIDDRKRFPGIPKERIEAPIFILGLPRAGSTFLHTLIAQDPENRVAEAWEMLFPSPPPEPATYDNDPRIAQADKLLKALGLTSPELMALHPASARLPEECHFFMENVAFGDVLTGLWKVSGYNRERAKVDPRIGYWTHKAVLQNLQHRMPAKRWVLKNPGHIFQLRALLDVYPDARLIQTHRDPARVMASVAATVTAMRKVNTAGLVREQSIALGNMKAYARALPDTMTLRAERPDIEARFCDVHFRRLIADPIGTVQRCYGQFGLTLSNEAILRMERWLQHDGKEHVAKHKITLEQFGLTEAMIEENFGAYIDHYGIARERPA